MRCFLDSNILLYSAGSDERKADRADALIAAGGWISVQVLNEVANVARRKMGYAWPKTNAFLRLHRSCLDVHVTDLNTHDLGLTLAETHGFSIWDAMIVATALEARCDTLYSEDMHHGLVIDGRLTIVNPFRA